MKKFTHTIMTMALLFLISGVAIAQNEFITTWQTITASEQITIPTTTGTYDYTVDWGDGTVENNFTGDASHTYADAGIYTVKISGTFPRIYFNGSSDKDKILTVEQWGNIEWSSMELAFPGCSNLTITAPDTPNLSNVTSFLSAFAACKELTGGFENWDVSTIIDMSNMFFNSNKVNCDLSGWDVSNVTNMTGMFGGGSATEFNGDISGWDVSQVTDMSKMFYNAQAFNQNISGWNVGNVTDMSQMFYVASAFNQNIDSWDVSNVTDMTFMFRLATSFNQPLNSWNVGAVTDMSAMFQQASSFNQPIGDWDVSQVTTMKDMFYDAISFNQDISGWNVGNVLSMEATFANTPSFNQDLSSWDVSKVTDMKAMFYGSSAYNHDLNNWDVSNVTRMFNMFSYNNDFNGNVSSWDVSKVTDMRSMFYGASSFNQNLSAWDISSVTQMGYMLNLSGLSTTNYDNMLKAWSALSVQSGVDLGASNIHYCNSSTERDDLINNHGWTITDAGQECLPFVTTWETTTASEQITIPTTGTGYDYNVDWGDGTIETNFTGDASHTYATAGTYTVSISGDFPHIYFNGVGDKDKIMTIEQWGNLEWSSFNLAFYGCTNLTYNATDAPNLSNVTNMNAAFGRAPSFNGDISNFDMSNITTANALFYRSSSFNQNLNNWDVSNITNMQDMFSRATNFNQPLDNWDVSSVTNMANMFFQAENFNQPIGNWDVSNVINMGGLFRNAYSFNQDISGWNTAKVEATTHMFSGNQVFNQDISGWDMSKVTSFSAMFWGTISFDQNLSNWNTASALYMNDMFRDATSFNSDLSNWDVSGVTNMSNMLDNTALSITNYDNTLIGWAAQSVQSGVTLGAVGIEYCLGATARSTLETTYSWTITDGGENCVVYIPDANFKAALLANVSINTTDDGEITIQEAEAYSGGLDVSGLSISDLTGIEAFINITSLTANTNSLTSLDLTNNTKLTSIQAYNNNLTSVDLTGLSLLHSVNFTNSDLTSIDLTDQTSLTSLYLVGNSLASIDLSANTSITILGIQANGLNSLDVTNLSNLQLLYAQDNNLTALDLSNNGSLTTLFLGNNSLQNIDLSQNTLITDLRLMNNSLVTLDLTNNTSLEKIFVNDNLLESFNVANGNNTIVTTFDASGNLNLTCITVDDVAYSQTNWTDVDAGAHFSTDCSNVENDITAFSFTEQTGAAAIDGVAHTVDVEVTAGTDLTNIVPTFTVSSGATADPASGVAQDFSSTLTYTITAENPTAIQEWLVTVSEEQVAPTDIAIDNSSIDENNNVNAVVGVLSTTDANANDIHTYSLVEGAGDTDNASFDISGSSLLALESFDFETKSSYSVRIQTDDGNGGVFEKEFSISVNDVSGVTQAITFDVLANKTVGDPNFDLTATATSGFTVSYSSSDETVATIAGSTVTIIGAGSTTITASQAGDGDYAAAANVEQTLTVNKQTQTITFEAIDDQLMEEGTLTLGATASSGLNVAYSITSGPATVSGNVLTFTGLGSVVVEASQNGNDTYAAATPIEQSFEVLTVTGLTDNLSEGNFHVYPNPVTKTLFVKEQKDIQQIQVVNMSGRVVLRSETNFNEIDVSHLKQGNYIIRVITRNGIISEQIIKK